MVRVITQQTYDDVVQENINDFDMSPEEAIEDAIQQFKAQGVDLTNIIKDLLISGKNENHLGSIIERLKNVLNSAPIDLSQLVVELNHIKNECDKDLAHKLMANREGAYGLLTDSLSETESDSTVTVAALKAMISLMDGQPDLLEAKGVQIINRLLENKSVDIVILTLKWIRVCCLKHERNRQAIFDAEILVHIKNILENHKDANILSELCGVIRYLVLDDDVRVEFGKAHEHARLIAIDCLHILTQMLSDFKSDKTFVSDILLTIATLVVRHEFCQKVEDAGGLKFILDVMIEFHDDEKLNRQCFKLLKALAGNDDVKRNIIRQGAATLICTALDSFKDSEPSASAGLGCVAALALREVDNSIALFDTGIAEVILQCMNVHKEVLSVQKNGSFAIRNMVARCPEQRPKFIELGAEDILNEALNKFGKLHAQDIKSALRDLHCSVKLDEQWTGKGGQIHTTANCKDEEEIMSHKQN